MLLRQLTIVGTGLIGGSIGLALKKHGFAGKIVGCDRAPVLERAREKGAIDAGRTNPSDAARGSQVTLLEIENSRAFYKLQEFLSLCRRRCICVGVVG